MIGQTLQHFRKILMDNAAFIAKVPAANIYMSYPNTPEPKIPMPCIIFEVAGGSPGFAAPIQQLAITVLVWSRQSQPEAMDIYEMARKLLDMVRLHSDVVSNGEPINQTSGYARQVTRPTGGYAEETQAYFAKGMFHAYTGTKE